jgi:hypothetical protein
LLFMGSLNLTPVFSTKEDILDMKRTTRKSAFLALLLAFTALLFTAPLAMARPGSFGGGFHGGSFGRSSGSFGGSRSYGGFFGGRSSSFSGTRSYGGSFGRSGSYGGTYGGSRSYSSSTRSYGGSFGRTGAFGRGPSYTHSSSYIYRGHVYPAHYYGGWSDYSFYWGAPHWYYYLPFHPAFYYYPPYVGPGGYYYPGGFNWFHLFISLAVFGLILWFITRLIFRGFGGTRYTSY